MVSVVRLETFVLESRRETVYGRSRSKRLVEPICRERRSRHVLQACRPQGYSCLVQGDAVSVSA